MNINTLQAVAGEVRKNIVTAVYFAKSGHPGGSLSAAEIYTYLYMQEMNVDQRSYLSRPLRRNGGKRVF